MAEPLPELRAAERWTDDYIAGRIEKGQRVKMDVQAGDKVIYGRYSGTPYEVGEDELMIIKASDILAKIG